MGFDQTTTTHHFRLNDDGGDFTGPILIHAKEPPGVKTMKAIGGEIAYTYEPIERGGVVRIATASKKGQKAVHEFLRFQIRDHAAP